MRFASIVFYSSTVTLAIGCSSSTTTNNWSGGGAALGGSSSSGGATSALGGRSETGGLSSTSTQSASTRAGGAASSGGATTIGGSASSPVGTTSPVPTGGSSGNPVTSIGGASNSGGSTSTLNPAGGATGVGGSSATSTAVNGGAAPSGGTLGVGGSNIGTLTTGSSASGGSTTGGSGTGGVATGGATAGGAATGGMIATGGTTAQSPIVSTDSIPVGTLGTAYSVTLAATNGIGALTWSISDGSLPTGLTLATNGKISGTPSAEGSFNFEVTVMDANGNRGTKRYTMTVVAVVKAIAAGSEHTCALMNSGRIMCWGENDQGQLGDGTTNASADPVEATGVTSATAIAAGSDNTCAILQSKEVVCWGSNASGQLGNQNSATQMRYASTAEKVSVLNTAVSVSVGSGTACAVTTTGEGYCWGAIATASSNDTKLSPFQVTGLVGATGVSGGYTACAIISGGTLKCWGGNYYGMLGDNTNVTNPAPVSAQGLSAGVQNVSVGTRHVCAAINGGMVQCWGNNYNDELGISYGSIEKSYVARTVSALESTIVTNVAAGDDTSCVVTSNGIVQCWGSNTCGIVDPCGLMGDLVSTKVTSPKTIWSASTTGAKTVTLGTAHGCFLAQDNGVYCWGQNYAGQLGMPTTTTYSLTPLRVSGI